MYKKSTEQINTKILTEGSYTTLTLKLDNQLVMLKRCYKPLRLVYSAFWTALLFVEVFIEHLKILFSK